MKKSWKTVCACLLAVSLLSACGETAASQQTQAASAQEAAQTQTAVSEEAGGAQAQAVPAAGTDESQQASASDAGDPQQAFAQEAAEGQQLSAAGATASREAADRQSEGTQTADPQLTLEEVLKNHDSFTDGLSQWNVKAEKRSRSAWSSNLSPAQEQAIIDSMNGNFKRAVLARAYETLENADGWDRRDLYLSALLKLELIPRDKVDAFLLARALYAENLEAELWNEINEILEKAQKEHPEDFPEPEIYPEAMEDGAVYEEAAGAAAGYAAPSGAMMSNAESLAPMEKAMDSAAESGAMMEPSDSGDPGMPDDPTAGGTPGQEWDDFNTAEYNAIRENPFKSVAASPLSTFSIDVDTAGYTKLKYDILDGYEIEKDEVKIEELINYFNYDYGENALNAEDPDQNNSDGEQNDGDQTSKEPFTVSTEYTRCPWNTAHGLIRIGIRTDDVKEDPDTNFVLVTDVSGSMTLINKLPLALSAYADMLDGFEEKDTISLMYYASGQGVVLQNVTCDKKETIYRGLADVLARAGGGTNGALGLQTAYEMAEESYIENGVNRVLIATDGDFNIGSTSEGQLKEIVEEERKKGVYLTILGYGSENLKDNKMETMAENGNGNYHYIGDMADARKALVQESSSTLIPMADDVKIQVEFNPALVQEYRLIGYESRILNAEDFNNDRVDAGDVGAGKSVTALYELVPAGGQGETSTPDLKYSKTETTGDAKELCTVAIRYKDINSAKTGAESRLVEKPVLAEDYREIPDDNTALAISLAEAGMVIRDSEYKGTATLTSAGAIAKAVAADTGSELAGSWAELLQTLIDQSE